MAKAEKDSELVEEISPEIESLYDKIRRFYLETLLNSPEDQSNCFIEIHAAAGGHEACDFTQQLTNMYSAYVILT
jgi:peptide chain release factor 2